MIPYFEAHQVLSFEIPDEKDHLKMPWQRAALILMLFLAHVTCFNRPVGIQLKPLETTTVPEPKGNVDYAGLSSGDIARGLWANPTWLQLVPKEKRIQAARISRKLAILKDELSMRQHSLQLKLLEMFNERV